jgi:uncharacterized protein
MARDRIVVDTNVLISSFILTSSAPAHAVDRAILTGHLVGTTATLRELHETLLAPRFERYLALAGREALLQRFVAIIEIVEVLQPIKASRDPRDDTFLEAAVNGAAQIIISGDRDLLILHPLRGVAILTPAAYLKRRTSLPGRQQPFVAMAPRRRNRTPL